MSILESIGIIAAVGFGATGLMFGWRADQRSKTAEQIARDSNQIAEESKSIAVGANEIALDSNRIATEANDISKGAVELQREVMLDQRAARVWIGQPWVAGYRSDAAEVSLRFRNEGKALARDLSISLFRNGQPYGQPEVYREVGSKEITKSFRILYLSHKSVNPDDVYLLRFEYRDELPERHKVEWCFQVSGVRNDERSEEWRFEMVSCPELESS